MNEAAVRRPDGSHWGAVDTEDRLGMEGALWRHRVGDHRFCGSACPNTRKDLRDDEPIWKAMVEQYGDPHEIDQRIVHPNDPLSRDEMILRIVEGSSYTHAQVKRWGTARLIKTLHSMGIADNHGYLIENAAVSERP